MSRRYCEGQLIIAAPVRPLCVDSVILNGDLDVIVYLCSVVAVEGSPTG